MEPELPTNVAVPERVLWQEVEGEVVLLDLGSDTYHALNDVGSRMWKALDVTGDVDAAYERLREVYDVDDAVLRQDVARLTLDRDDVLVLDSDGVLDAVRAEDDFGPARPRATLAAARGHRMQSTASRKRSIASRSATGTTTPPCSRSSGSAYGRARKPGRARDRDRRVRR